jgi:16S rRNA (guanine966-N2)-methyltransferase
VVRIVAGTAGGRRLAVPPGRGTRPTSDRTREGLFSSLVAIHGSLEGVAFLDLYAGSGAVGLEAASRGATPVVLVEKDPGAVRVVRANLAELGLSGVEVIAGAVERVLREQAPVSGARAPFTIVFVDPPYATEVRPVLDLLLNGGWLTEDGTVVVERATRDSAMEWASGITLERSRRYGDSTLWYGRRS